MLHYRYRAIDIKSGKEIKGRMSKASRAEVVQALKQEGQQLLQLEESKPSIWSTDLNLWIGKPVKQKEFVTFCRQFAALIEAGSTVVDSIGLLKDQAESAPFKKALHNVYDDVRSGETLSDACEKHQRIFDHVFVNMIRAGELSGSLDITLDRLAKFSEREYNTREKVKSALTYPIMVSIIAVIVVTFLLTNVIPKFVSTLIASGGELPLPTKIVIGASNFMQNYWLIVLVAIILIVVGFRFSRKHPQGRYMIDYAKLRLPVFGNLIRLSLIARMSRTLASLFASAVPILQAMTMVSEIVNNEVYGRVLNQAKEDLRSGGKLSAPLEASQLFPPTVTHMIKVGEDTGNMDKMLDKIADFYEQEVDHLSSRLSAVLEPLIIAVLAVVVGGIVLAAMLPMFEIYQRV